MIPSRMLLRIGGGTIFSGYSSGFTATYTQTVTITSADQEVSIRSLAVGESVEVIPNATESIKATYRFPSTGIYQLISYQIASYSPDPPKIGGWPLGIFEGVNITDSAYSGSKASSPMIYSGGVSYTGTVSSNSRYEHIVLRLA